MAFGTGLIVASLAVTAIASAFQIQQGLKSQESAEEAQQLEKKRIKQQATRESIKIVERARRARASAINASEQAGAADGSVVGGFGSVISQARAGVKGVQQDANSAIAIGDARQEAQDALTTGQVIGSVDTIVQAGLGSAYELKKE